MPLPKPYLWGIDLGEVRDYTGVAVVRARLQKGKPYYTLGVLERYNGGARGILQTYAKPGLDFYELLSAHLVAQLDDEAKPYRGQSALVVDGTGSGREATIRFLRGRLARIAPIYPLQIRPGELLGARQRDSGFIQVTRKDLLGTLAAVLDSGRLAAIDGLEAWPELRAEMLSVRLKEPRSGAADAGPRLAKNDDLALALAMCVWAGDQMARQGTGGYVPVRYVA